MFTVTQAVSGLIRIPPGRVLLIPKVAFPPCLVRTSLSPWKRQAEWQPGANIGVMNPLCAVSQTSLFRHAGPRGCVPRSRYTEELATSGTV